jgi:hypothetical protein
MVNQWWTMRPFSLLLAVTWTSDSFAEAGALAGDGTSQIHDSGRRLVGDESEVVRAI